MYCAHNFGRCAKYENIYLHTWATTLMLTCSGGLFISGFSSTFAIVLSKSRHGPSFLLLQQIWSISLMLHNDRAKIFHSARCHRRETSHVISYCLHVPSVDSKRFKVDCPMSQRLWLLSSVHIVCQESIFFILLGTRQPDNHRVGLFWSQRIARSGQGSRSASFLKAI